MAFVVDDLGSWLIGKLADAGHKKLITLVLGTDQERALRSAATAAVRLAAEGLRPDDDEQAEHLALVINQVFGEPMPDAPLAANTTVLEALQAGIAGQLAVLDDAGLTGTGKSSAELLGLSAGRLAQQLTSHLLREIMVRGARGGPLAPLAAQLNHDMTHLKGQQLEVMLGQLTDEVREALARLHLIHHLASIGPDATPVSQWDPFSLGVHRSIIATQRSWSGDLQQLPFYVPRDHDRQLRDLLNASPGSPLMVVLTGLSCTGKTRAAYEAVRNCLPEWRLIRPETAGDLLQFLADNDPLSPKTVIWLNETQIYLDGQDGEKAAASLRRVLAGSSCVVVLGSMWTSDWQALTARPSGDQSAHNQARELLDHCAVQIPVPATFAGRTLAEMRRAAAADPRLAEAVEAASETGEVIQILAGGPWLIDFYDHKADPYTKAVLNAAITVRELGHWAPESAILLEEAAVGYLDERQRAAPDGWFNHALLHATARIKGAVAPLAPVRIRRGTGEPDGYLIHDYLFQEDLTEGLRSLPPPEVWQALAAHTLRTDDHARIAHKARRLCYWRHAAIHYRPPAAHGDADATYWLAQLLEQAGQLDEALKLQERLADQGDVTAAWEVADLLGRTGHIDKAAAALRQLAKQHDRRAEVKLEKLLEQAGRIDEALELWRSAANRGNHFAMARLVGLLERAGQLDEALAVRRQLANRGNADDKAELVGLLERAGQLDEALAVRRQLANRGNADDKAELARLLERVGRVDEAVEVWQHLAQHDAHALLHLADVLGRAGRAAEEAAVRRTLTERDDPEAMSALVMRAMLLGLEGQVGEAIALLQPAADRGNSTAIAQIARILEDAGRAVDAREVWRSLEGRADASGITHDSVVQMTGIDGDLIELHDNARSLLELAKLGNPSATRQLALALERAGWTRDAELWLRYITQSSGQSDVRWLADFLMRTGRTAEAERVAKFGLEPGGLTADPWGHAVASVHFE